MRLNKIKNGGRVQRGWRLSLFAMKGSGEDATKEQEMNLLTRYFKYRETKAIVKSMFKGEDWYKNVGVARAEAGDLIVKMTRTKASDIGQTFLEAPESSIILAFGAISMIMMPFVTGPVVALNLASTAIFLSILGLMGLEVRVESKVDDLIKLQGFCDEELHV